MLREVSYSYELASMVQHLPFQFHAFAYTVQVISVPTCCHSDSVQCECMRMTTITGTYICVVQNLTLLTGMITPQHTMLMYTYNRSIH